MYYYNEVLSLLQWMVMDIQKAGMLIDQDLVASYRQQASDKLSEISSLLDKALGYHLNPSSPKQVFETCTKDLGLRLKDSTDELSLLFAMIDRPESKPFIDTILAYRDLTKKRGTYLNPTPWPDGRVRSQFRTYGTLTYRLSSRGPDLQNLPRSASHGINIKDIYIAPPGKVLVEFDYSALEDRIPSYASGCKKLIHMFETGQNTHLYRASIIFGRPITSKKESPKEYDFAKRLRYAKGYGSSISNICNKLLEDMHEWHPPSEIGPMIESMDADTPEIQAWHDACWNFAEKHGYLLDGFGLRRTLYMPQGQRRQVAYSWPTQTTASGIMNRSMVRIYKAKLLNALRPDTICVCQVHDSLLFEMNENFYQQESVLIKHLMEEPVMIFDTPTPIKFPVEAKVGKCWGQMKEF